jgi:hypothetical protein
MRRGLCALGFAAMLGCSDATEPSIPSGPMLIGRWAAAEVGFVALYSAAELHFPCSYVAIDHGIVLDPEGAFAVQGILHEYPRTHRVTVSGRLSGNVLELAFTRPEVPMLEFELIAGRDPVPPEVPACPQTEL